MKEERGVLLIIFAIALLPILAMIALAVDSTFLAESYERSRYFSRLAALRALESYFSGSENSEVQRRADALAAAKATLAGNDLLKSGTLGTVESSGSGATLVPGIWHYTAPSTGSCSGSSNCFEGLPDPAAIEKPNAFRISGALPQTAPTFLAQNLFSASPPPIEIDIIASVVPRRGCFLVDMSRSTASDTYVPRTPAQQISSPAQGHGAYFAYFLEQDNPTFPREGDYNEQWEQVLRAPRPTRASGGIAGQNTNTLVHYADDYVLKARMNDSDYALNPAQLARFLPYHPDPRDPANTRYQLGNGVRHHYRVDQYRRTPSHRGPEPLRTILSGLRTAITEFKNRRVSGDMACLIFYDQFLSWARVVKPTSDFDYLLQLTDYTLPDAPPLTLTDDVPAQVAANGISVSGSSGFELAIRHGIFPSKERFTDTRMAMTEALQLLSDARVANPGIPSSDFMVLIGDGLTNCVSTRSPTCSNQYVYYRDAHESIAQTIIPQLIQQNIAAHVMMLGDSVGPHTIDIRRSPTDSTCIDDSEARTRNINFVGGGDEDMDPYPYTTGNWSWDNAFMEMSPTAPFYQANADMYNIAKRTRGLWIPIRAVPNGCVPQTGARTCGNQATRLRTDPQCRSDEQQVIDGMKGILGQNPYVIVSVR